jgi:lipopolysaccharide/colanic/teichoic acid biosynthesis glycosyltransferase
MKNDVLNISSEDSIPQEKKTISIMQVPKKPVYSFFKRVFDIICSALGLIVLMVPLLIVALIITIDSPGASPIYVQERVGKNGHKFKFYKFRSMVPNAEKMLDSLLEKNEMEGPAFKMKNDPRITRVGSFIRKTSIDELPQLWNVLKGERGIIETTKKNIGFSRVVAVNSISS